MKIQVDVNRLRNQAAMIKNHATTYESDYKKLMTQVDLLAQSWKGKDNLAFSEQVKSFQDDFIKMKQVLNEYANYLETCAKAYQELQNDRAAKAKLLSY